ncbi:primase alpha helix C-terminal domain-containing protein, partial [Enterococcus faecium]
WLVNLLLKKPQEIKTQYRPVAKTGTAKKLDMIVQGAGEGSRNDHLTKLCGWLLWHGVDNQTLAELIYTANAYNEPPLKDKEVNQIIRSMIKKDLRGKAHGA